MPNRLAAESSPYLLQHKDNPVDWFPWGKEALEEARRQDKPILLSIGYSACHWCHVMERESFEDDDIAAQMNRNFISIKVDREERPDIDSIYMTAVQALAGHGRWPLTVFLMPDGRPFYGGTYFPPSDRGGMPGFPRILDAVSHAYRHKKGDLELSSEQFVARIRQTTLAGRSRELLAEANLSSAYANLSAQADREMGGLSGAPKFPQPMI
ncbi:MAG: thioredoxin domain-containing protein, partial [Dehalococcoidia bacterium]|nr:thioredoxin domain-containing protein [Dehalococcoidia bacterium]